MSHKGVARPGIGACLLALCLALCLPVWAQVAAPATVPGVAQADPPRDPLDRTTPKGTVLGFLLAAKTGDKELAAQYLNTRARGNAASDLVRQLFTVLDRRLPPTLPQLSDKPEGTRSGALLRPDMELVGSIDSANGKVDIVLERVDRGKAGTLWLFSGKTLAAIPDLYEEINQASVNDVLPEFLVAHRFAGIALFHWVAILVGMPLFYYLVALVDRVLGSLIGRFRRRHGGGPDLPNPHVLPPPIRLLLLALVIHWTISSVSLPLLGRQFWISTAAVITIGASVWLLIHLNSWVEQYAQRLFSGSKASAFTAVLRLGRRAIDLLLILAGVLVTLYYFGLNPSGFLAGLGVGGIAVALAAQKTLENVIGGVSLILDQVGHVGDTVKVSGVHGTIESMSLRSTRIRTRDRTLVSVPNGQMANMTLENVSARDKFWLHSYVALRHGTPAAQIQTVVARIRTLIAESGDVEQDSVRVFFHRLTPVSLEVEVFAYIMAGNLKEFLAIQEGLLLRITECLDAAGVQIAHPVQDMLGIADGPGGAAGRTPDRAHDSD